MDFDRNSMTVPVQSSDYTKKFLQKDSNPTTMEVVTQTNAVKSPTDSPEPSKLVYTVEEIARMLAISLRSAYNLCNSTTEFRVLRVGGQTTIAILFYLVDSLISMIARAISINRKTISHHEVIYIAQPASTILLSR